MGERAGGTTFSRASLSLLLHRLLEGAMSGKYLHDGFTLPCPPGLKIPEEDGYTITPNTLKVPGPRLTLQIGRSVLEELVLGGIHKVMGRRGGEARVVPLLANSQRAFLVYVG